MPLGQVVWNVIVPDVQLMMGLEWQEGCELDGLGTGVTNPDEPLMGHFELNMLT